MMFGRKLDTHRIFKWLAKVLIRLPICAGWSEPLLVAHTTFFWKSYVVAQIIKPVQFCTDFTFLMYFCHCKSNIEFYQLPLTLTALLHVDLINVANLTACVFINYVPQVWASLAFLCCGPWARHIYPSLVLVQPRKNHPCLTERLLMGRKESNQTKFINYVIIASLTSESASQVINRIPGDSTSVLEALPGKLDIKRH